MLFIKDLDFLKKSLQLNIFYLRIMAEHAALFSLSLPEKNSDLINESKNFYNKYTVQLNKVIDLSSGIIDIYDEAVTKYTLDAELKTMKLTNFKFDLELTKKELNFKNLPKHNYYNDLIPTITNLNNSSIDLTKRFIRFKTKLIEEISNCNLFMSIYPLMVEHNRREAISFIEALQKLQNKEDPFESIKQLIHDEVFWNDIMEEHSMFIRGLLDPNEEILINIANEFVVKFKILNEKYNNTSNFKQLTKESKNLTDELKKFKTSGAEGILNCKVKSIIPPIIADHILREANHYLNILEIAIKL